VAKALCKPALSIQVHSVWPMVAPPDSLARRNMKDEAAEVVPKRKWYDYKSTSFWRFIAILCVGGLSIVGGAYRFFDRDHYIAISIGVIAFIALLFNAFHDSLIKFARLSHCRL
jgi:hypothetical protein